MFFKLKEFKNIHISPVDTVLQLIISPYGYTCHLYLYIKNPYFIISSTSSCFLCSFSKQRQWYSIFVFYNLQLYIYILIKLPYSQALPVNEFGNLIPLLIYLPSLCGRDFHTSSYWGWHVCTTVWGQDLRYVARRHIQCSI